MNTQHDKELIEGAAEILADLCISRLTKQVAGFREEFQICRKMSDRMHRAGRIWSGAEWAVRADAALANALEAEDKALALASGFGLELPPELTDARWSKTGAINGLSTADCESEKTHRGVGEGDAGLPESAAPSQLETTDLTSQ